MGGPGFLSNWSKSTLNNSRHTRRRDSDAGVAATASPSAYRVPLIYVWWQWNMMYYEAQFCTSVAKVVLVLGTALDLLSILSWSQSTCPAPRCPSEASRWATQRLLGPTPRMVKQTRFSQVLGLPARIKKFGGPTVQPEARSLCVLRSVARRFFSDREEPMLFGCMEHPFYAPFMKLSNWNNYTRTRATCI